MGQCHTLNFTKVCNERPVTQRVLLRGTQCGYAEAFTLVSVCKIMWISQHCMSASLWVEPVLIYNDFNVLHAENGVLNVIYSKRSGADGWV